MGSQHTVVSANRATHPRLVQFLDMNRPKRDYSFAWR